MKVTLVVGDWSHDGHEKTHRETIEVNVDNVKEVEKAYKKGVKKAKFDLMDHCSEYEDSNVPVEKIEKLKDLGFKYEGIMSQVDDEEDQCSLGIEDYVSIYLFLLKLGGLEATLVETEEVNIGGYGLFY